MVKPDFADTSLDLSPETMALDFDAVAKKYRITSDVQRSILRAMMDHEYVTLVKLPQQNVALVGKAHGTLTKAISRMTTRLLPVDKERHTDTGGTTYTRYVLNRKKVAAAMAAKPS